MPTQTNIPEIEGREPHPLRETDSIDYGKLTKENLFQVYLNGETPLHRAATQGKIKEIPQNLLQDPEVWTQGDERNRTPLHNASTKKCLDQVPIGILLYKKSKLLDSQDSLGTTPFSQTIAQDCFHQLPEESITLKRLLDKKEDGKKNALELLTISGDLGKLPKGLQTPETFTANLGEKQTSAHVAAANGTLDQVPQRMFTSESLLILNENQTSPLIYCLLFKTISQIPINILDQILPKVEPEIKIQIRNRLKEDPDNYRKFLAYQRKKRMAKEIKISSMPI